MNFRIGISVMVIGLALFGVVLGLSKQDYVLTGVGGYFVLYGLFFTWVNYKISQDRW